MFNESEQSRGLTAVNKPDFAYTHTTFNIIYIMRTYGVGAI